MNNLLSVVNKNGMISVPSKDTVTSCVGSIVLTLPHLPEAIASSVCRIPAGIAKTGLEYDSAIVI